MKTISNKNSQQTLAEIKAEHKGKLSKFAVKYPQLFSKLEYLEIQEGWHDLVRHACAVIQQHIDYDIPEELREQVYFSQIKQKFGGLRLYLNYYTPYLHGTIAMAEDMSYSLCEVCGQPGSLRDIRKWLTTLCDRHYAEESSKL